MSDNNTSNEPLVGKEVALGDLLSTLLKNEDLHDLILKGNDGLEVGCHKAILATRSTVFQGMLFGKYSEASQKTVELGFKGEVLQAVVEYIYTDKPQIINIMKKRKNSDNDKSSFEMEQVKIILCLADASNFFHLPGLMKTTINYFSQVLAGCSPSALFAVLETLVQSGPTVPGSLMDAAMNRVRYETHVLVSETGILSQMSDSSLELILDDQQTGLSEEDLFEILQNWTEINPTERKTAAIELAKHIRLEHIDAATLNTTVSSSGLFSSQQLNEAYKCQAMWLSKNKYGQPRDNTPVWRNSLSMVSAASSEEEYELDLLNYPPIKSGKHVWKIELLADTEDHESVRFGIASAGMQLDSSVPLGNSEGGWAVSDYTVKFDGFTSESQDGRSFYPGDVVTLTLDLCPQNPDNGCLKVTAPSCSDIVFENLHDHLKRCPGGFVPAISTCASGRVRILEILKDLSGPDSRSTTAYDVT